MYTHLQIVRAYQALVAHTHVQGFKTTYGYAFHAVGGPSLELHRTPSRVGNHTLIVQGNNITFTGY